MRPILLQICVIVATAGLTSASTNADIPITADRAAIRITGTTGKGPLSGTVRLAVTGKVSGMKLLVSDLPDDNAGPPNHDPIAANAITITPAIQEGRLEAGIHQFALQVSSPSEAGCWKGSLLVLWQTPEPGRLELPIVVTTHTQPALSVANPQQLSYAGKSGHVIRFRFHLKETAKGSDTSGLKVIVSDLRGTSAAKNLPGEKICPTLQSSTMAAGSLMPVPVTVDLHDVESGKYTGQMVVTDVYRNEVAIPLEVSVKDEGWIPLLVLVFGVVIGMASSVYRARGRRPDELTVRVDAIKKQAAATGPLKVYLEPLVQRIAAEAIQQIVAKNWDAAAEALGRGETLIARWCGAEEAWVAVLADKASLDAVLDGELGNSAMGRHLQLHLATIDLPRTATASALADELGKAQVWVDLFKGLQRKLRQLDSGIQRLASPELQHKAGETLEELGRGLLELKPDDKQKADTLANDVNKLGETVRSALDKDEALRSETAAFELASEELTAELGKTASIAGIPLAKAIQQVRDGSREESLETQNQIAQNVWRGLWSGNDVLHLVSEKVREGPGRELFNWLMEAGHYALPPDQFTAAVQPLERAVMATWPTGAGRPEEPKPPRRRSAVAKAAPENEELAVPAALPIRQAKRSEAPRVAPWRQAVTRLLQAGDSAAAADRSRLRLQFFKYGGAFVALVILVWTGYAQLYEAVPTFGADGVKDYLLLFLWGFGAEATRSAVTDVVKGLVPAT